MKMKKVQNYKGFVIAEDADGFYSFMQDEWTLGDGFRSPEMEHGSLQEAKDFIDCYGSEDFADSRSEMKKERSVKGTKAGKLTKIRAGQYATASRDGRVLRVIEERGCWMVKAQDPELVKKGVDHFFTVGCEQYLRDVKRLAEAGEYDAKTPDAEQLKVAANHIQEFKTDLVKNAQAVIQQHFSFVQISQAHRSEDFVAIIDLLRENGFATQISSAMFLIARDAVQNVVLEQVKKDEALLAPEPAPQLSSYQQSQLDAAEAFRAGSEDPHTAHEILKIHQMLSNTFDAAQYAFSDDDDLTAIEENQGQNAVAWIMAHTDLPYDRITEAVNQLSEIQICHLESFSLGKRCLRDSGCQICSQKPAISTAEALYNLDRLPVLADQQNGRFFDPATQGNVIMISGERYECMIQTTDVDGSKWWLVRDQIGTYFVIRLDAGKYVLQNFREAFPETAKTVSVVDFVQIRGGANV